MKVRMTQDLTPTAPLVRERREKNSGQEGFQRAFDQERRQKKERDPEEVEKEVQAEVLRFREDAQSVANGLTASTEQDGPGLKVVLKDGSGTVIRQLTGEEFLKLREAVEQIATRGKILDQKL